MIDPSGKPGVDGMISAQQTGSCGNVFSSANRDCRDVVVLYKPESDDILLLPGKLESVEILFSLLDNRELWRCLFPGKQGSAGAL